jgi:methylglutaconyl-CoA hydratase
MKEDSVLLDATRAGVAVITLNRPEVHNAFNALVIERLNDIFDELRGADGVRVVLLEGTGKNFSAGADLEWMRAAADYTHADNLEDARALSGMLNRLHTLPQPTIALVSGAARGGGVGLIAACDMAIATRDASFAFTEAKLGLIPATIAPFVMHTIGERAARRYFLTSEIFDVDEAHRLGLVQSIVEDKDALAQESERMVTQIFQNPPGALHAAKDLIQAVATHADYERMLDNTAHRIADIRATEEGKEGVAAFLEKRKPSWVV